MHIRKYKIVYNHGLIRHNADEKQLQPSILKIYRLYCEKLVIEDRNNDIMNLCYASASCLAILLTGPPEMTYAG
jgi:hypothetical protein